MVSGIQAHVALGLNPGFSMEKWLSTMTAERQALVSHYSGCRAGALATLDDGLASQKGEVAVRQRNLDSAISSSRVSQWSQSVARVAVLESAWRVCLWQATRSAYAARCGGAQTGTPAPTSAAATPARPAPPAQPRGQPTAEGEDARNCVDPPIWPAEATRDARLVNRCPFVVQAAWCVVGVDCNPSYTNTHTFVPGADYPIHGTATTEVREIRFAACRGKNTIELSRTNPFYYACNAPVQ